MRLEGSVGLHALGFGGSGSVLRSAISGIAFDGGAGRTRVAGEEAALRESYAVYRAAVLGALRDAEDAMALLAYQEGSAGLDAVLASQAMLLASEEALLQSAVAQSVGHVQLYKALGGGWQPDSAAP